MKNSEEQLGNKSNQTDIGRWIPFLIGFCVLIGASLLAFAWWQNDGYLSDAEKQSLDNFEQRLTTRGTQVGPTAVSNQIQDLIKTSGGKDAMRELDAKYDNLVFDADREELYYTILISQEAERSKSKIRFIKCGPPKTFASIGLTSGVEVVSLDIEDNQFEIVIKVDDDPGMHLVEKFGFEPSARYKKTIDLSSVRLSSENRIMPGDITDFENYSKVE